MQSNFCQNKRLDIDIGVSGKIWNCIYQKTR